MSEDQTPQEPSATQDTPPLPPLYCELCGGVLEPHEGSVTHLLLRLVREPNPHEGWWREHPAGPRWICDWCYASDIHPLFAYGAPEYVPRDKAVTSAERSPRENEADG